MVNSYSEVFSRFKKKLQERSKPSEVIWKYSRSAARIVITEQKLDFSHHAGQWRFTKQNKDKKETKRKKELKEMYV